MAELLQPTDQVPGQPLCEIYRYAVFRLCGDPHKRKNWLFTGSENGGKTMTVLFSVVSSCQRHGHDPFAYLRDLLTRLSDLPAERLIELLPDRWKPVESPHESGRTGK